MLNVSKKRLAAAVAIAGSLCVWGASANATTITALENGGVITPLLGSLVGISYFSNDGIVSGPGSLKAVYEFSYSPPPTNTAVFATTNNPNPALISGFSFAWYYSGNTDLGVLGDTSTNLLTSNVVNTNIALPLGAGGFYYGVVTGTIAAVGGNYTFDMTVTNLRDQGNTPLPAALPLFASVLGGGGLLARWRKKRASNMAAA